MDSPITKPSQNGINPPASANRALEYALLAAVYCLFFTFIASNISLQSHDYSNGLPPWTTFLRDGLPVLSNFVVIIVIKFIKDGISTTPSTIPAMLLIAGFGLLIWSRFVEKDRETIIGIGSGLIGSAAGYFTRSKISHHSERLEKGSQDD